MRRRALCNQFGVGCGLVCNRKLIPSLCMPALCPVSRHLLIHCSASTSFPLIVTNAVTHRRSRPCARLPCARFPCICSFTAPHPLHIHECCHSTSHTVRPSIFARKGIQREDAAVCYPSQPALWLSLHCCSAHSRRASHHVSPTLRSKPFLQPILMTVRHIVRQSCHPNFHTPHTWLPWIPQRGCPFSL